MALVGGLLMLAALGMAWPQPRWIIAVATLDALALAAAAFRWRLPMLHAGVIACATLAYLTIFHLATGQLLPSDDRAVLSMELLRATVRPQSGTALAGLLAALAAVCEGLVRLGRRRHAVVYLGGCAMVAFAGILLTTYHGLTAAEEALRAAILYAVYGAGSMALAARWRRTELSALGVGLLAAAPPWALWWHTHHVSPLWAAVLAVEALVMAVAAALLHYRFGGEWREPWRRLLELAPPDEEKRGRPRKPLPDLYRTPLAYWAELTSAAALAVAAATCWLQRADILETPTPWPVVAAACLAAVYFILAWQYRSPARTWIASCLLLAGLVHSLNFNYVDLVLEPWLVALLTHGAVAVAAGLVLDFLARKMDKGQPSLTPVELRRVFSQPLADSALFSSLLVLPALVFTTSGALLPLAICLFWLAALWLVLAWRNDNVWIFAAHQAALTAATLVGATAWLNIKVGSRSFAPPSCPIRASCRPMASAWRGCRCCGWW